MNLILLLCVAACLVLTEGERTCPRGEGWVYAWSRWCEPCLEGSYASDDTDRCRACPRGYTNRVKGAHGGDGCTMCKKAYYRDADTGFCVACPQGMITEGFDSVSCIPCPEGQTTESAGEDHCFDYSCSPGYGWDVWWWECSRCRHGYYSPDGQTLGCLKCPEGYTTSKRGAVSEDECSVREE